MIWAWLTTTVSPPWTFATSRVGEHHIDVSFLSFHGIVEWIQIGELRDITLHSARLLTQEVECLIQLRLSSARNEDIGPLRNESLSGSESDPACATCDDCNLSFQLPHCDSLLITSQHPHLQRIGIE